MLIRSVPAAALAVLLAAGAPADEAPVIFAPVEPPAPLTAFQWALKSAGSLLLVPADGYLWPARLAGEGVIETLPERVEVALHRDGELRTLPLGAVVSPLEIGDAGWILERRAGEDWVPAAAMLFHGTTFYAQQAPGPFLPLEPGEIRFRPRSAPATPQ